MRTDDVIEFLKAEMPSHHAFWANTPGLLGEKLWMDPEDYHKEASELLIALGRWLEAEDE